MTNHDDHNLSSSKSRIVFGSCNSQHRNQTLWPAIVSRNASAWIWGGDAIYGDSKIRGEEIAATPESLAQAYQNQLKHSGYQQLLQQNRTIVGVWDDHDYGINNGDRNYRYKKESAALFVDFLEQSSHKSWSLLAQRAREEKGVYGVLVFDFTREEPLLSDEEAGLDPDASLSENTMTTLSEKSVAIFLLDVRYNKTPWGPGYQNYEGDFNGDFLGEEQWKWLEEALSRSTARVNIVFTGLQVHPDRWFDGNIIEDWGGFPMAQHRLYQNLLRPNVNAPIIVSGDVHMAQFLRRDCKRPSDVDGPFRSLVEVTASGMTHSWGRFNCPRMGNTVACRSRFIQLMSALSIHIAHLNHGWRDLIDYKGPRLEGAKRRVQYSLDINFGEFEFDWDKEQVTVRILGADTSKPPQLSMRWDFDTLSTAATPTGKLQSGDFTHRFETMTRHSNVPQENDWICLPNAGATSLPIKFIGTLSAAVMGISICVVPILAVPVLVVLYFLRRRKKSKLD